MANYYQATDRMAELIEENYRLLQVISRFGMSLGFGDRTVAEVCEMHGVDTTTFLALINFMHSGYAQVTEELSRLSVPALIDYLRQSHAYFLDFQLPRIRRDLQKALGAGAEERIAALILKQFDRYRAELARHMRYEERHLFPYVEQLLAGRADVAFELTTFSRRHHSMDDALREIKEILVKYNPEREVRNELNAVLYDIYGLEDELDAHCKAEDYIFVPAVYDLSQRLSHANG